MSNQIIYGDCIASMDSLTPSCARLIVADPPYFNVLQDQPWDTSWATEAEYLEWSMNWINSAMRLLVPGGLLYCFGQLGKREHVFIHLMSQACMSFEYHDLVIWDRAVGYNDRSDSWTPAYEMALVLRKPGGKAYFDKDAVREPYDKKTIELYAKDKRYKDPVARMTHLLKGKIATNLWRIPSLKGASREKIGHPSQKPEALINRIVASSSRPGDLVIDPFLGSGTTAAVSQQLDRNCIGIEQNIEYVEMARSRLGMEKDCVINYEDVASVEEAMRQNIMRREAMV